MKNMDKLAKKLGMALLVVGLTISSFGMNVDAANRETDKSEASEGNTFVGVQGTFEDIDVSKILKRVNEIRKEACKNGYIHPNTGEKLTMDDYVEIQWSSTLEWIASIRAAESTVYGSHTRPNGTSCFTVNKDGEQSWGEVLAWNNSGLMQGIEQWYGEKKDWVKQNKNAVTGHYTAMINPSNLYIGISAFDPESGGWIGVAGEFSSGSEGNGDKLGLKGKTVQTIEVADSAISGVSVSGSSSMRAGSSKTMKLIREIVYSNGVHGSGHTTIEKIDNKNIKWKSSNTKILTVNNKGKVTAKKKGKAKVIATYNGKTYKKTIQVK